MSEPHFSHASFTLWLGDCREIMADFATCSVDAIVADPPYGLGFMGKEWDNFDPEAIHANAQKRARQKPIPAGGRNGDKPRGRTAAAWEAGRYDQSPKGNRAFQSWCESWATEALRVLKPGGHMLVCGSPRTYHRLASGIEDAGFEIRDCLQWIFGSGFPKSLNLHGEWEGWGTALKPAYEPIVMARKPLAGTVATNVAAWGTGGLNIDGCRIGETIRINGAGSLGSAGIYGAMERNDSETIAAGRWPANVLLDKEAAALLDSMSGETSERPRILHRNGLRAMDGWGFGAESFGAVHADSGGASRYFYTAKTSRGEREFGLGDFAPMRRTDADTRNSDAPGSNNPRLRTNERHNDHPTVKPVDLMRWLCRLVMPPGGIVLDPFLGSGSTGMAALDEGFQFLGIDKEEHYLEIARRRITRRHTIEPLPQSDAGQASLL